MPGIITVILGAIIVVMAIINMTGNISTLHAYHRKNVTEENRKPFGRRVGIGTLIIGVSVMLFGGAMALFEDNEAVVLVASAVLIVGIVVGSIITFRAMHKYNGGIF